MYRTSKLSDGVRVTFFGGIKKMAKLTGADARDPCSKIIPNYSVIRMIFNYFLNAIRPWSVTNNNNNSLFSLCFVSTPPYNIAICERDRYAEAQDPDGTISPLHTIPAIGSCQQVVIVRGTCGI